MDKKYSPEDICMLDGYKDVTNSYFKENPKWHSSLEEA